MSELSEHVKRTVVNLSIPEGEEGRVQYEYYTVDEWAAIEAEKEAQRIPQAREKRISEIKVEAHDRICAVVPEFKQRNNISRALDLVNRKNSVGITVDEEDELQDLCDMWNVVRGIRTDSDAAELEVSTSDDPDNVTW